MRPVIVIPTYNNAGTIADVVARAVATGYEVIVVNDGSTDGTYDILAGKFPDITIVSYEENRGKGYALQRGIETARTAGYTHAVTLDGDGQHYPEDVPVILENAAEYPDDIVIGVRGRHDGYKSRGARFANAFSNFWFGVQTISMPEDTQSGFRVYPLDKPYVRFFTSRYEAELAVLVWARWQGRHIRTCPVRVYYPPKEERVSHFRPGADFGRISILNTVLTFLAFTIGYPMMLYHAVWPWIRSFIGYTVFMTGVTGVIIPAGAVSLLFKGRQQWYHHIITSCCRVFTKVIPGVRFRFTGREYIDGTSPCIIVSNHQSVLDLVSLMSLSSRLVFMVSDRVWNHRLLRYIVRPAGFVPVSAGITDATKHFGQYVREGYSIAVFPEGTRTRDGKIHRYRNGAFVLAETLRLAIQPVVISGAFHILPKHRIRVNTGTIDVHVMPRISAAGTNAMTMRHEVQTLSREAYDRINHTGSTS